MSIHSFCNRFLCLFVICESVMAESDGPSMPPQKKPKRESHFDSSWINDFNDIHIECG